MKTFFKVIGYGVLGILAFSVLLALFSPKQQYNSPPNSNKKTEVASITTQQDQIVIEKLKLRAKRDWPNDYTTQEFWVNQQIEDYEYMKSIPQDPIKKKAQKDWPFDFTTQKYWYNEQIEAKERIK